MNTALTLPSKTVRLRRSDPPVRHSIAVETTRPAAPAPEIRPSLAAVTAPVVESAVMPVAPAAPAAVPAKKINVAEHPLAQHALMALRNKHTTPGQFRQICNQLLVLLSFEATRSLPTRDDLIETHATTHTGSVLAKPVIFLSLARHGLGLAHNVADFFPGVLVGTITLARSGESAGVEPRMHIVNAPALSDARVIVFDPVIATGGSATAALNFIRRSGATDVTLVTFLASFQGLSRLQSALPDLSVWTAGIDADWDSKRGPMPGLGNFAERFYG